VIEWEWGRLDDEGTLGWWACNIKEERSRRWGECGSHLVLPKISVAEFIMDQHLFWYVRLW